MKSRDIVLVVLALVIVFVAATYLFPGSRHLDIALSGPPGLTVKITANVDGVATTQTVTVPVTLSYDLRREFEFNGLMLNPTATLEAKVTGFMGYTAVTEAPHNRVRVVYHGYIPGLWSSGSIGAAK